MIDIKRVLITTSGVGSRLGELTKYTNKTLLRVGEKPVISHIIDSYPSETTFVITLGYFGQHVREYLTMAYKDRRFDFVEVQNYRGERSSLVHSLACAKNYLNSPFIYHASDTLINLKYNAHILGNNWIAGKRDTDSTPYASFNVDGNEIVSLHDKAMLNSDFVYVGVAGVQNYEAYWNEVKRLNLSNDKGSELSDVEVMKNLLKQKVSFKVNEVDNWFDTGSTKGLNEARATNVDPHDILEKENESIFFIGAHVIKFFHDTEVIKKRVKRARELQDVVPKIVESGHNFMKYPYVDGSTVSKDLSNKMFRNLLSWLSDKLWINSNELNDIEFNSACMDFYREKTLMRVDNFFEKSSVTDEEHIINGVEIPSMKQVLGEIDFDMLSQGIQSRFHGDLILDNIIVNNGKFTLIDWRQDFGKSSNSGDRYYDFAKLMHSLYIDHEIIKKNLYTVRTKRSQVSVDILRKESRIERIQEIEMFLENYGYDKHKVDLLTGLIWLNMSSLHHHPFNTFLFYFGKYKLWNTLKNN